MRLEGGQLAQIRQSVLREMGARIHRNVNAGAPEYGPIHGDRAVGLAIAAAVARAHAHGFEVLRDVERYVLASLVLGHDFATDPQLPWAARALLDTGAGPDRRAARLHDRATHYASLVFGPRRERLRDALGRLGALDLALPSRDGAAELHAMCVRLYPRKAEVIGDHALSALIAEAPETARAWGLKTPRGVAACVGLQFMIGARAESDARVPWVGEILRDTSLPTEEQRILRLLTAAWDYAERWRRAIPVED